MAAGSRLITPSCNIISQSDRPSSLRWAVFISGRGSNLRAILDMQDCCEVAMVVSSSSKAGGLARARRAGVFTHVLPKPIDWQALDHEQRHRDIDAIFLAGFMRIIPPQFIEGWAGRILNIHPSWLPLYPGLQSIERAYNDQERIGVTIHEVIPEVDQGKIISQRQVFGPGESSGYSLQDVEYWVHVNEHRLVREVLRKWKPTTT